MFFYFTGNGYWMGWNTLCLWRYCINEVIWALIFSKNEKEQISLTFYIIEISVLFSRSCGRSSSSGSRALFLLLLSPPSLLHLGRALPCCSRLCPLSDKGQRWTMLFEFEYCFDSRWQNTNSSLDVADTGRSWEKVPLYDIQIQNLIFLPVSGIVFKSCTFAVSNIYR